MPEIDAHGRQDRSRRRNRHRGVQPGVPPSGGSLERPGRSSRRPPQYAEPQYAPPPPPPPCTRPPPAASRSTDDKLAQLSQLGALRDAGVLTDIEFEVQKSKILSS